MSPIQSENSFRHFLKKWIIFYRSYKAVFEFGLLIILGLVGYALWYSYDRAIHSVPAFHLNIENTIELLESYPRPVKALYDPDGLYGPAPEQDVTKETIWNATHTDIVYVGTKDSTSGVLYPVKVGTGEVVATYQNFSKTIAITVVKAPLTVTCAPLVLGKNEQGEFATTKDAIIEYVATYVHPGVPDYKYQWRTSDGQVSQDIIPNFHFSRAGVYTIQTTITDRAGTTVDITCAPLHVLDK